MRRFTRHLLQLAFFLFTLSPIFLFSLPTPARADENFDTRLHTTYLINDQGTARVTHEFTIINKTPLFFVKQYGLKISSNSLQNVVVKDGDQTITPEITKTTNETSIGITFPDRVVGQEKERLFSISYTNPDATVVSGQVLEVYVPKLANTQTYSQYQLSIVTPLKFGQPSRVHPENYNTTVEGNHYVTTLTNQSSESVVAVFGDKQVFNLNFRYHLENPANGTRLTQIALIPDTSYQQVVYNALDPAPEKIERDADGNWIATYQLPANTTQVVQAQAQVQVNLSPVPDFPTIPPTTEHLRADDFWPTQNPEIQQLAAELNSVESIYHHVIETLSYDYDRLQENPVNRFGALDILSQPQQAMCQEYTDVFIALSRAQNVPARRATGFAYTENEVLRPLSFVQDVLHAWPEYYDRTSNQWIPVDPTWEDTSGGINYFDQFDLNHVVFAYNGTSSSLPLPAGSYKTDTIETKDIEIEFGQEFLAPEPEFAIAVQQPKLGPVPLSHQVTLQITNATGRAFYNLPLEITPSSGMLDWQNTTPTVESILPFQTIEIPVTLVADSWWQPQTSTINLTYADQTTTFAVIAAPRVINQLQQPIVLLSLGICLTVITLTTWSVLVFRQKR